MTIELNKGDMLVQKANKKLKPGLCSLCATAKAGGSTRSERRLRDEVIRAITFISFFCLVPHFLVAQKDSVDLREHKIFYFIDADCENCSVSDYKDSKIWIATNPIQSADMNDHEALLKKFRDILIDKYKADSALVSHAVFRYQDSEKQASESYELKESKMKGRGYVVIKIEF